MSNAYNKELSSSIKNSNKEFIKEQYKLDHKKSASKVSLYYSHGQTEKTENSFISTKEDSLSAEALNDKTVKATNLTENVVLASKQSLQDSSSTTSNVSTAAANMQIAANAITKLASDVAALKSVAKNTANESKILKHTSKANDLIQDAAKKAEEVSLVSMQATIEAAQATASTVVTNADASLDAIKNLHSSTASNYSNLQELTVTDSENLTTARKNEKLASAKFDVTKRQDMAIKTTRGQINKVSNHNLTMIDPQVKEGKNESSLVSAIPAGDSFTISFDSYDNEDKIKDYRLIVAKYDDAEAFDINIAKDLEPGTYYQFAPSKHGNDKKRTYAHTFYLLDAKQHAIPSHHLEVVKEEGNTWRIVDTDKDALVLFNNVVHHLAVDYKGKPIDKGTPYVAYVYVVYKNNYQHSIDSTVGDLSQPSERLTLQEMLYVPEKVNVFNPYFNSRNLAVSFQLPIEQYEPKRLEYRIMAVEAKNVEAEKINKQIEKAINELEAAEYHYNAENNKLIQYTARYNELRLRFMSLSNQIEEQKANPDPNVDLKELIKQQGQAQSERDAMKELKDTQDGVTKAAKKQYQKAKTEEAEMSRKKINDFIFDTDLMMTVTAANYYVAEPIKWDTETAGIKWAESWISHEIAKFNLSQMILNDEPDAVTKLRGSYTKQLAKVETAQSVLVEQENALEDAQALNEKTPKSDDGKAEIEAALKVAEDNLRNAKNNLTKEEDRLNDLDRQIEVAREKQEDVSTSKISKLINEMIATKYDMEMYRNIIKLIRTNYVNSEIVEFEEKFEDLLDDILDYLNLKDEIDKIEELLKEGKLPKVIIPEERFKPEEEPLPLVLMYTEIGNDATDNYGEPLFQNQSSFMSQALAEFLNLINIENAKDRADEFKKLVKKYDPKGMKNELLETPRISYKAVVLSALASAYIQDAKEYKNTHSDYSEEQSIIYKTQ
ncbi:MAG: hypothetical protein ABJG47_00780 [Ekhidna sp.]